MSPLAPRHLAEFTSWRLTFTCAFALVLFLFTVNDSRAQCPKGYMVETKTIAMDYGGVCCQIKTTYYKSITATNIDIILKEAVVTDPGCWGIALGSPPPFSIAYTARMIQDKVLRDEYPGTIPLCPQTLDITVGLGVRACGKWVVRVVDPDGPSGPIPEYYEIYVEWCGSAIC